MTLAAGRGSRLRFPFRNGFLGSRVEDRRAGLGRSLSFLLARSFVCECLSISTLPRLLSPPRRTQLAELPHYAPPFASRLGLWDLSCWGDFQCGSPHAIAVEQPKRVVEPPPIPSLPTEALSFPCMRQMTPDLLLRPVLDEAEALARVPHGEVVHPPPENRVDQADYPTYRLRSVAAEHLLEPSH